MCSSDLVDVILGVRETAVPDLGAIAPRAGSADVVEVVQRVAGPSTRDGGNKGTPGLFVGDISPVPEVGEVGQGAGGHQGARITEVPVVHKVFRSLPVVEDGYVGLVDAFELRVVIGPLKPLNGVLEASGTAGREGCGQCTLGDPKVVRSI